MQRKTRAGIARRQKKPRNRSPVELAFRAAVESLRFLFSKPARAGVPDKALGQCEPTDL